MHNRLVLLAGLTVLACGQPSEEGGPGRSGGAAGGLAGMPGSGGGSPSTGGVAGAGCGLPPYYCVPSWCGGDVVSAPQCEGGSWGDCPEGFVHPSQCPDDACFHPPVIECCDANGKQSKPTCPGQAGEVCAPDSYMWMYAMGKPCPPAGMFPCGDEAVCELGKQYCWRTSAGTASCESLPPSCGSNPTCACLTAVSCGQCHDWGLDALTVYCN